MRRVRPSRSVEPLLQTGEPYGPSSNSYLKSVSRRMMVLAIIVVAISAIPVLVFVFGGNAWVHSYGTGNNGGQPTDKRLFDYPSISALKGNSTLVIEATVTALSSSYCNNPHPGCLADNFDFQVNAISYLKGSGPETVYVVDDDGPLLAVGSKYVLFLKNGWTCLPSPPAAPCILPPTPLDKTFGTTGGAEGKFLVQNDLVYGYKALYPLEFDWMRLDVNGVPLAQFEAALTL